MDIKYPNITIIFIINRIWYTIIFPPADNDRANDKVKILAIAIGYKLLTIVYHRLSDTLPCGSEKQVQMKGQSTTVTY